MIILCFMTFIDHFLDVLFELKKKPWLLNFTMQKLMCSVEYYKLLIYLFIQALELKYKIQVMKSKYFAQNSKARENDPLGARGGAQGICRVVSA